LTDAKRRSKRKRCRIAQPGEHSLPACFFIDPKQQSLRFIFVDNGYRIGTPFRMAAEQ
jgi:hypothetical protein